MAAEEFNLERAFVLVRPYPGTPQEEKVADITGWTDISDHAKGQLTFNPTRAAIRLRPTGSKTRGKIEPGDAAGTGTIAHFLSNANSDRAAIFEDALESPTGKIQIVAQREKPTLQGNVIPAPTLANPMYVTSAFLTSVDIWGPGGQAQAIQRSTFELDEDYAVYRT